MKDFLDCLIKAIIILIILILTIPIVIILMIPCSIIFTIIAFIGMIKECIEEIKK